MSEPTVTAATMQQTSSPLREFEAAMEALLGSMRESFQDEQDQRDKLGAFAREVRRWAGAADRRLKRLERQVERLSARKSRSGGRK